MAFGAGWKDILVPRRLQPRLAAERVLRTGEPQLRQRVVQWCPEDLAWYLRQHQRVRVLDLDIQTAVLLVYGLELVSLLLLAREDASVAH